MVVLVSLKRFPCAFRTVEEVCDGLTETERLNDYLLGKGRRTEVKVGGDYQVASCSRKTRYITSTDFFTLHIYSFLDLDDNLSKMSATKQILERLICLFKLPHTVHDWPNLLFVVKL